MRTLIVEDDFTSRSLLLSFLSEYGECHMVSNGKEALDAFRAAQNNGQGYDLICLDIMMPEMDGHTALSQIRALEEAGDTPTTARVKIIMTTALKDKESVVRSIKASCDAYLVKPIHKKALLNHIRDLRFL